MEFFNSTGWAFYVQVAVSMRLPDACRLHRSNPAHLLEGFSEQLCVGRPRTHRAKDLKKPRSLQERKRANSWKAAYTNCPQNIKTKFVFINCFGQHFEDDNEGASCFQVRFPKHSESDQGMSNVTPNTSVAIRLERPVFFADLLCTGFCTE